VYYCLWDRDPLFVHDGGFDFGRFVIVEIGESEQEMPDFIVEEPDYHLGPYSPAIGTGSARMNPVPTDIEGTPRECGSTVDLGAYESPYCEPQLRFVRGDCDGDGSVIGQVTDAIFLLAFNFTGEPEPRCLAACDANGDGEIIGEVTDAVYLLAFNFLGGPAPVPPLASDLALGCEQPPEAQGL
jgi:hypothetical protein